MNEIKDINMKQIADERIFFRSPSPKDVSCFTPGLSHAFNGRILATIDLGGATDKLEGPRSDHGDSPSGNQVRTFVSDDQGDTWRETGRIPMCHPIPFKAGKYLYIIGQSERLIITRSGDNGETWSECSVLESEHRWHQSAGRIDIHNGKIFLVYEQRIPLNTSWPRNIAPVLMAADENADLLDKASWTFSKPFDPETLTRDIHNLGIPFESSLSGALETNVFRICDKDHLFYDPEDRTVILVMRTETGIANVAAFLKGVEHEDGSLEILPLKTPSGETLFLHPFPGGEMKFHMDYDPESKLYWLVSSQVISTFRKKSCSWFESKQAYNNRSRLRLSFSINGFDWCHAGMIAMVPEPSGSRHYASLLIVGNDILVLSRSGDKDAHSPHNGNLITLHRIRNFRNLAY